MGHYGGHCRGPRRQSGHGFGVEARPTPNGANDSRGTGNHRLYGSENQGRSRRDSARGANSLSADSRVIGDTSHASDRRAVGPPATHRARRSSCSRSRPRIESRRTLLLEKSNSSALPVGGLSRRCRCMHAGVEAISQGLLPEVLLRVFLRTSWSVGRGSGSYCEGRHWRRWARARRSRGRGDGGRRAVLGVAAAGDEMAGPFFDQRAGVRSFARAVADRSRAPG